MDVITRALRIFDSLVVAVALNPSKKPLFSFSERIELVKNVIETDKNLPARTEVTGFETLTVDLARKVGAASLIRGLRAVTDFEYELQIALTNRKLAQDIESVFLMPSVEYIYLNSTVVKEVAKYGGDVHSFVHDLVADKLKEKFQK